MKTFMASILYTILTVFILVKNVSLEDKFTIAVVQYEAVQDLSLEPAERINENALRYIDIINSILKYKPDLVVFPEGTLDEGRGHNKVDYSFAIYPGDNPCMYPDERYPIFLRNLSCLAVNNKVSFIINMIQFIHGDYENRDFEIVKTGAVDSRMLKFNRIGEDDLAENNYLSRDYRSKQDLDEKGFGIVALDHIFRSSGEDPEWVSGIRNYVVSSKWRSELPFLTSLQVQQMWAYEENFNLYVAAASNPSDGIGGAGIYLGQKEPIFMDLLADGGSKVYVYSFDMASDQKEGTLLTPVQKKSVDELAEDLSGFKMKTDDNFRKYTTKVIDITQTSIDETLCHKKSSKEDFCCRFKLTLALDFKSFYLKPNKYSYHMVAFSGHRNYFETYSRKAEICGIVACMSRNKLSCGVRFQNYSSIQWPVTFKSIVVQGNFYDDQIRRQYPSTLLSSMRPVSPSHILWTKRAVNVSRGNSEVAMVKRRLILKEAQSRLMTFAIYGRDLAIEEKEKKGETTEEEYAEGFRQEEEEGEEDELMKDLSRSGQNLTHSEAAKSIHSNKIQLKLSILIVLLIIMWIQ